MSINKLKSIAHRGVMLGAAFAVVAATFAPASLTFADALNPLTHRSLTLSSSAPGWDFTDGSGNSTYAPPNSGANGQKTGNTFSFNVSTDSSSTPIKAFTFQYCTFSAGNCYGPGNNAYTTTRDANGTNPTKADLSIVASTPTEISSGTYNSLIGATSTSGSPVGNATPSTPATVTGAPLADDTQGNFIVETQTGGPTSNFVPSFGWSMAVSHVQDGTVASGHDTSKNNYITLTNSTGVNMASTDLVKIIFFATNGNYITNPGAGDFFVKINDYNDTALTTLVDGGVTVANVVNQSIEIQTKVLETMDFSVGTVDPYTLDSTGGATSPLHAATGLTAHGQCDPIAKSLDSTDTSNYNVLKLGDQDAESSLRTDTTYSTHSFWRLSSNSSSGATVYYSGVTLKNTVGDQIAPIGVTADVPKRGTPQFGLAIDNGRFGTDPTEAVAYGNENNSGTGLFENAEDILTTGIHSSVATDTASLTGYHAPQLFPLKPTTNYTDGAGVVNGQYGTVNTKFAFDPNANIVPTPLATESSQVVDCVSAKVRYIADIAATTPAGIYTTKVNYIAAPQY